MPPGLAVMDRALLFPGAMFRRLTGWTPPASGWSSHGHHAYGASWKTSPRYGDRHDDDVTAQMSDPVAGTYWRRMSMICCGHSAAFREITYQRFTAWPPAVPTAALIRTGVPLVISPVATTTDPATAAHSAR